MRRMIVWKRIDDWGAEVAEVDLAATGVRASGTQLGRDPQPYRVDYDLDASDGFVTRRLLVRAAGEGWERSVDLARHPSGVWRCDLGQEGEVDLPAPGGDGDELGAALDCDLGLSPLTNMLPIRRHDLHRELGDVDLVVAWISVPDLAVHASEQRYEHVRADAHGATVRFLDRGLFAGFVSELELDPDGLVRVYPELARRV
jgi:uncharacterized protein